MTVAPIRSSVPAVAPEDEILRAWHPGPPRGKGRARCTCRSGKPQMFTPRETVDAGRAVEETLRAAWGDQPPYEGLVVLECLFALAKPRGGPADADNLVKLVGDALDAVVIANDRQVCGIYARRVVAPAPESVGTLIIVGRT